MKYSRSEIVNLRKLMIKYGVEKNLVTITDMLIDYPEMVNVVTDLDEIPSGYVKREHVSTGHGAFGEPEGYTNEYVCGQRVERRRNMILLNDKDEPIFANKFVDIEKIIEYAIEYAVELSHKYVTVEHLAYALVCSPGFGEILEKTNNSPISLPYRAPIEPCP